MKKKFISALLFGALVASSTSTLVSCKDYDDDINSLKTEITTNASTLNELVTEKVNNLNTEINALKTQQESLKSALDKANTDLTSAITAAKSDANKYADVQAAAAQKAAIEAAKASLDSQVAILQAAIDKANASINDVNNKVTSNSDQIAKLLQADADLQNSINTVKGALESSINTVKDAAANAQAAADKAQAAADKAQGSADDAAKAAKENAAAITKVSDNLDTIKKTLENQISVLGDKLDNAVADIAKNKQDLDNQLTQATAAIKANTDLINEIKDANDKAHTDLLKKIGDNTDECTRLAGLIANAQAQCSENLKTAFAYTDSKAAELTAALTGQIDEVKGTLAGAITRIGTAETSISDLQKKYGELVEADDKASNEIKNLQEELGKTNKAVSDNMKTLTQSIATISSNLGEIKKELEGKINVVDGKVDANTLKIEKLKETLEEADGILSDRIRDNELAIDNIEEAISNLDKDIKGNATALDNFKTEINNTLSQKVTDLDTQLRSALATEVSTLNTTISKLASKDELSQVKEDLLAQIALINGDKGVVSTINESIRNLQAKFAEDGIVTEVKNDLKDLTDNYNKEVSQLWQELAQNNAMISQVINAFNLKLAEAIANSDKRLKSLVFSPEHYNQGIEAIEVYSFNYRALSGFEATPDLDKNYTEYTKQENKARFNIANTETETAPLINASYYLNPSNAAVDLDKSHYSFYVNNATVTRSISANEVAVDNVTADKDVKGKINVFFNIKNSKNISDINNGSVDVAALKYTNNDTTIVSDFAALTKYDAKDFAINKGLKKTDEEHLATSAAAAIASSTKLEVVYDNAEGIDLDQYLNVHYNLNNTGDQRWGDQKEINKYNFKMKYDLVGYISGSNHTNESRHAKLSGENNHILTPQGYNNETGRQIIDRTPLVRVLLINNANNEVVTVGYIKVVITDKAPVVKPAIKQELPAFNNGYTVMCDGEKAFTGRYTWDQIENELLSKLDVSKAEFETNWEFVTVNGTSLDGKQYTENSNGLTFDAMNTTNNIGTVKEVTNAGGQNTHVLEWTIDESQAYTLLITNRKNTVSTWVCFKHNVDPDKNVYVKLTWNVTSKNVTPTASILDNATHKVYADWHADGSRSDGWKELHIQVGNATDPNASCEFASLVIDRTFNKLPYNIVKDAINGTYGSLANNLTVAYKFAPAAQQNNPCFSGRVVVIKNNGSELYVKNGNVDVLFATLDPANGTVTLNDDDFVKQILNRYDYAAGKTGEALTFKVGIYATTCDPMGAVTVNNNTFNVRVIKPMFLNSGSIEDMNLNNFSTLTRELSLEFIDFNGYTESDFYTNSNGTKMFKDFYEITSIEQNGNIKTNYKNKSKLENVDNSIFTVDFSPAIGAADANGVVKTWGTVKLTQVNMSRANDFKVVVPVKVTYKWGTLTTNVTFKVKAASGDASKRH